MADYLDVRRSLAGVVLMVDSRLGFTDLDRQLLDFVAPRVGNGSVKLLVLLTKADKLNRREADAALRAARATRSATLGTDDVRHRRRAVLRAEQARRRRRGGAAARLGASLDAAAVPVRRMSIETFTAALPHGITLSCRAAGPQGAPLLVFLHGFPEAAFVWDELLEHFAPRYRCIAPNLRGYERSSAPGGGARPTAPSTWSADIARPDRAARRRAAALVAHDWGGALAWGLAAQHPQADRAAGDHQFAASGDLPARAARQPGAAGGQRLHELPVPARTPRRCWPRTTSRGCGPSSSAWAPSTRHIPAAAGSPRRCASATARSGARA